MATVGMAFLPASLRLAIFLAFVGFALKPG